MYLTRKIVPVGMNALMIVDSEVDRWERFWGRPELGYREDFGGSKFGMFISQGTEYCIIFHVFRCF